MSQALTSPVSRRGLVTSGLLWQSIKDTVAAKNACCTYIVVSCHPSSARAVMQESDVRPRSPSSYCRRLRPEHDFDQAIEVRTCSALCSISGQGNPSGQSLAPLMWSPLLVFAGCIKSFPMTLSRERWTRLRNEKPMDNEAPASPLAIRSSCVMDWSFIDVVTSDFKYSGISISRLSTESLKMSPA